MSTDLETALRNAAKSGRLNHVSLASTWDGKWEAGYRGVATDNHRIVGHSDPVSALIGALTSKVAPEPVKVKKPAGKRIVAAAHEALAIANNETASAEPDEFEDLL